MSRDESQSQSTAAIAIAASAVTIAVGVTIGALMGYIRPPAGEPPEAESAQASAEPVATSAAIRATEAGAVGQVVLVPIQPAVAAAEPAAAPPGEPWLAAEEQAIERAVWLDDDDRHEHGDDDERHGGDGDDEHGDDGEHEHEHHGDRDDD